MRFAVTFRRGDRVALADEPTLRGTFLRYNGDGANAVVEFDDGQSGRAARVPIASLRHAPVTIVGPLPPPPPTECPWCGGTLTLDNTAETVDRPGGRRRRITAVFCGACEFAQEVKR